MVSMIEATYTRKVLEFLSMAAAVNSFLSINLTFLVIGKAFASL